MKIELWRMTPEPETLVAEAYGICTNKNVPVENIQRWIKMGHESPLEHASASVLIEGISRACLAQLTRHRLASFSVQSMRYVDVGENPDVFPPAIRDNVAAMELTDYFFNLAENAYKNLIVLGIKKEDARFVLPLATTTSLIMTANFREWRHVIELRTNKKAQWEIRELAEKILAILVEAAPAVFSDLSQGKE